MGNKGSNDSYGLMILCRRSLVCLQGGPPMSPRSGPQCGHLSYSSDIGTCVMAVCSLWSCSSKTPRLLLSPGSHSTSAVCSSTINLLDTKCFVLHNIQHCLMHVQLPHGCVAGAEARNTKSHGSWTSGIASKQGALSKRFNTYDIFSYSKMSPFLFLAKLFNDLDLQSLTGQRSIRPQVLLGYWIGPEGVDGWGFVEAYLVPS
ncbi:hypothetical protein GOP47_0014581 [Adiantum capillus-veneris]|uniref:Uncharacterized protein n=1 Tax=Adiantum capillus-veneris TaxID=13818 RepID=A0A9D4ZCA9_ADICA|nr:hypothetical protein GOP47_0014581 [Adiantum capillus-veneris]